MRLRLQGLAAVALAAGALGCGSEEPPPDEPIDELARYLPGGDSGGLALADVAAAREQLGLSANADALAFEILADEDYDPRSPEARLLASAGLAMPNFGTVSRSETYTVPAGTDLDRVRPDFPPPKPNSFTEAFDGRAIAAAVTGGSADGPRGGLTAIRTSQPFDELADALARQGYQREGDVLSKPGADTNEVAYAGGGVVVLSNKEASAAEAIADPGGGLAPALALLEPADEPVAMADVGLAEDCVTGYGGWHDATGSSGAFVIAIDGAAELERVERDGFERFTSTDLGEPSVEGSAVEVPFSGGGEKGASPLRLLQVSFGRGLYDCG
jgi:hypothetical protein